ncbi:MAG: cytochrome c-type biogenesis protein [Parahaliea sp.]
MRAMILLPFLLLTLLGGSRALAVIESYDFSSPELALRYRALSQELRCPRCQNQNIADSDAPIAQDLRRLLHQQLEDGATDAEILDFMVARYGEFVRYRPEMQGPTLILWLLPGALLLLAAVTVVLMLRSRNKMSLIAGLSDEEQARFEQLLQQQKQSENDA